jgi:glycosyltransferase involved in cell wall biosynthesis
MRLQKSLNVLGERLRQTGVFDKQTAAAVQRFQARIGRQVDGIVSDEVWKAIESKAAEHSHPVADVPPPVVDVRHGTGIWEGYSTSKRPGVQIVMTVRNGATLVGRALNSLETAFRQSDWVLIFVDDGSEDQTYAVAADRETTASARVFRRAKPSKSIGAARNYALSLGKEYRRTHPIIYFFDADDVASPNVVTALFDPMMCSGCMAAFGDYQLIAPQFPADNQIVLAQPENQPVGNIPIGTVAFHASLIPQDELLFREDVEAHEDGALWIQWFKSKIQMLPFSNQPICQCFKRIGSVSCPQNVVKREELNDKWSDLRINIMEANLKRPMVSALMLTGKCPEREPMARVAVRCFLNQTWPNKQLVIINHGKYTLATGDPRIKEIKVVKDENLTLGDMRNRSIDESDGEWLIQWDDDDWHHPARMEIQMERARVDCLVTFLWQIRLNLVNETAFYDKMDGGQHMSILFHRRILYRYLPLEIREDTEFKRNFKQVEAIDNSVLNPTCDPLMYIRTFHGRNIWDVSHVMGGSAAKYDPTFNRLDLVGYHLDRVRQIIMEYKTEPGYTDPAPVDAAPKKEVDAMKIEIARHEKSRKK